LGGTSRVRRSRRTRRDSGCHCPHGHRHGRVDGRNTYTDMDSDSDTTHVDERRRSSIPIPSSFHPHPRSASGGRYTPHLCTKHTHFTTPDNNHSRLTAVFKPFT
jgi:hypothetical protein